MTVWWEYKPSMPTDCQSDSMYAVFFVVRLNIEVHQKGAIAAHRIKKFRIYARKVKIIWNKHYKHLIIFD